MWFQLNVIPASIEQTMEQFKVMTKLFKDCFFPPRHTCSVYLLVNDHFATFNFIIIAIICTVAKKQHSKNDDENIAFNLP